MRLKYRELTERRIIGGSSFDDVLYYAIQQMKNDARDDRIWEVKSASVEPMPTTDAEKELLYSAFQRFTAMNGPNYYIVTVQAIQYLEIADEPATPAGDNPSADGGSKEAEPGSVPTEA